MNILAVLSQSDYWQNVDGTRLQVRKMTLPQKSSVIQLLESRARAITDGIIDDVVFGCLDDEPLGTHAGMTVAEIVAEIEGADPVAWLHAQPLVMKLRADVDVLAGLRKRPRAQAPQAA